MNEGESQEPVFALLADPATHGGAPVKRIDTHAASVFLAGTAPSRSSARCAFPFLDYSTLDKRKEACEAELEVNRPFAPEIYRGVVPITREADGRLALDGDGAPVEWAVEMRRFDEDATLDRLAEAGRIDAGLADALGRAVAAAHAAATAVDARALDRRRWPTISRSTSRPSARCPSCFRRRRSTRSRARAAPPMRASIRSWSSAAAAGWSAASTAIFISATSSCSTAARCCSTPSNSAR